MSNTDLYGPTDGPCELASELFEIIVSPVLSIPAVFTVTSSNGADTITPSTVTVPAGQDYVLFSVTPATCGTRTITISSSTTGVVMGTGTASYTSDCNCPNNSGSNSQSTAFTANTIICPPLTSLTFVATPSNAPQVQLYCNASSVSMVITE